MSRRLSWALVALASVALLAGCGESEKEKYTNKLNSITDRLVKDTRKARQDASAPRNAAEAGTLARRIQAVLNRAAHDFAAVKPPSKVMDLHERLVNVIRRFSAAVTPEVQAAEAGDLQRFRAGAATLAATATSVQRQLNDLRREYRARGYKLE